MTTIASPRRELPGLSSPVVVEVPEGAVHVPGPTRVMSMLETEERA